MIHVCEVVENVESQIDVDLVEGPCVFSQLTNLFFFRGSLFRLLKSAVDVLVELRPCTVL